LKQGFAVLCFACAGLLAGCAPSPKSSIDNFIGSVEKGNLTEAQSYISSSIKGMLGESKLKQALAEKSEEMAQCGGVKSIDVDLKGEGEYRTGTYTVHYKGDCAPEDNEVKLVKEDGKWKLGVNK